MIIPKLFDVVKLKQDLPEEHLGAGSIGTVVEVLKDAVVVEFLEERDGSTLALPTLTLDQIEPVLE